MTEKNILENITSIELGSMTLDGEKPTPVLTIKTKNSNYVFRLSETFDLEKHISIFRAFVMDLQSDVIAEQQKQMEQKQMEQKQMEQKQAEPYWEPGGGEEVEKPIPVEKHDGARLFDEPPAPPTDVEITTKPVATQD